MPKFEIVMEAYCRATCYVEVEAPSRDAAIAIATGEKVKYGDWEVRVPPSAVTVKDCSQQRESNR